MKKDLMKKVVATGLALTMVMGGGTAAFAKGNEHKDWNDRDDDRKGKIEVKNDYQVKNNIQINLNFNDMKSAEWAMRYIASLASKRVFEGYEDGTFKPEKSVSRIEAITAAVRLMGLREQAESAAEMQTKLNFKDADKIPSWAVGYVAVALENDLFTESDDSVQPQKEADRLWATTLLVKALKLEAEAKAKMNTTLTFKDAKNIPAGSVGYIAVAIEKGLVDGFEDNTFRPNQPVTRAQLAALLDRTGNQLPDQDQNTSNGTVNAAVANNVLSLTKSGTTTQYTLHPDVFILRDGVKVSASAIQIGDEVKVRSYNNTVVFIEVTKTAAQTEVTSGTVATAVYNNTLSVTKNGTTYQLTLSPNVFVYRNGAQVAASALQVGDEVSFRTSANQVYYIEVTKLAQVNQAFDVIGVLNSTTLNAQGKIATISVTQNINGNNQTSIYNVSADVALTGNLNAFTQGHLVQLKGQNQVVTSIDVK
ncbi:S-layer homology domain-containing protein [Paenibacillus sedimenti]|uniref:S-layer homology domain-containing protein n=1 Tax=Paenibacillus sedimenti TaxID=2770274 RepID=A0A926KTT0_9BACL|nr:S-layer homology domain-containing protein [Paenibacillus sedimenti]MBD0383377.1 S-layer homology domain-containing protein [Paenibacillus sedimenti]